ncbi:MAG: putative membrane protein YphA (DoxX/SURF4 family) [Candidatus Paceibacteria bacterium]|jgi:uncharacterized membrane protein YphA (DoxX/SURF4 family)
MESVLISIKIIVALGIYNVWLIRPKKSTTWRGGHAKNMKAEFKTYGLSKTAFYLIGFIKISLATLILIGIWVPFLSLFAAACLTFMMAGAIYMHIKVKDPLKKSLPALIMFLLSALIVILS